MGPVQHNLEKHQPDKRFQVRLSLVIISTIRTLEQCFPIPRFLICSLCQPQNNHTCH